METTKIEWFYVGEDIQIQIVSGKDNIKSVTDIFDNMDDLITINEINTYENSFWLENEGNVFAFFLDDFNYLKYNGICRIYFIGKLNKMLNKRKKSHRDFLKWYNQK